MVCCYVWCMFGVTSLQFQLTWNDHIIIRRTFCPYYCNAERNMCTEQCNYTSPTLSYSPSFALQFNRLDGILSAKIISCLSLWAFCVCVCLCAIFINLLLYFVELAIWVGSLNCHHYLLFFLARSSILCLASLSKHAQTMVWLFFRSLCSAAISISMVEKTNLCKLNFIFCWPGQYHGH